MAVELPPAPEVVVVVLVVSPPAELVVEVLPVAFPPVLPPLPELPPIVPLVLVATPPAPVAPVVPELPEPLTTVQFAKAVTDKQLTPDEPELVEWLCLAPLLSLPDLWQPQALEPVAPEFPESPELPPEAPLEL